MNLDRARAVADAVLYEGYLLYPYRASSDKNRVRWQFGVVGPPGVADAGLGEESSMSMQCLLAGWPGASLVVHVRCLQLQRRQVRDARGAPVEKLTLGPTTWTTWDEATECEVTLDIPVRDLEGSPRGHTARVLIEGGEDREPLTDADGAPGGSVVRRRWPLYADLRATATRVDGLTRLELRLDNTHPGPSTDEELTKDWALRGSFLGAHLLVEADQMSFVSLLEPPDHALRAAAGCQQHRCWPVLTGTPGDTGLVLGSPIILYDYPEIAGESAGALFDATEIDEILTLRVMTMTETEKAEARVTDPRAREIIDRCDEMSAETLQQMHGVLREPQPTSGSMPVGSDIRDLEPPCFDTGDVPWWSPEADESVQPSVDAVSIDGVSVARDTLVRVHPSRRADAQDLFFAEQVARVTAVLSDVDGGTHVALVLLDDPAADLNDLAGRYWYFDPDEVSPLTAEEIRRLRPAPDPAAQRQEK